MRSNLERVRTQSKTVTIIQCHSVGWEGVPDVSLQQAPEGQLVIEEVVRRAKRLREVTGPPVLACPDVPANDIFGQVAERENVLCFKGSSVDVLGRLQHACRLVGGERFVWLQGVHFFLDVHLMDEMIEWAMRGEYDYARVPDGTCKQTLGQILSLTALERARALIDSLDDAQRAFFTARPLAFMRTRPDDFKIGFFERLPSYSPEKLRAMRATAAAIYIEERARHTKQACAVGDASRQRYHDLLPFVAQNSHVLDIACGAGYGLSILAHKAASVVGVDISQDIIESARAEYGAFGEFRLGHANTIPASAAEFDQVVSVATIEHVRDDKNFVAELGRVLKPNGRAIIYTPQSRMGTIPIWPWHEREYNIQELRQVIESRFTVEQVIGWQNGAMTERDERGDGMFVLARRKRTNPAQRRRPSEGAASGNNPAMPSSRPSA